MVAEDMAAVPATGAHQDKLGDACDPDDDNDHGGRRCRRAGEGRPCREPPIPPTPLVADSDGDRCLDGVEGYLGTDPTLKTSKCPAALTAAALLFFRACRWNEPPNGYDGGTCGMPSTMAAMTTLSGTPTVTG